MYDSQGQGQSLALTWRQKSSKLFKVFHLRSEVDCGRERDLWGDMRERRRLVCVFGVRIWHIQDSHDQIVDLDLVRRGHFTQSRPLAYIKGLVTL